MTIRHSESSRAVLQRLEGWGFRPEVQQRVGAFIIVWSVFETQLELTVWALRNELVDGKRPSTDGVPLSKMVQSLSLEAQRFDTKTQELLRVVAAAADDLRDYRHSVVHGYLIPSSSMPAFLRNPGWHGEVRKRPSSEAYVDENLLDMAIDAAWTLCRVVMRTRDACADAARVDGLKALAPDVARARSQANELRHLAQMASHEKY